MFQENNPIEDRDASINRTLIRRTRGHVTKNQFEVHVKTTDEGIDGDT